MAAPSGPLKAGKYFAVLGAIIVVLWSLVFLTGDHKPKPKLGLDLQGGVSMTLAAQTADGKSPDKDKLDVARGIISQRVDSTGVSEAEVLVQGNQNIVVNVAGHTTTPDKLQQLVAPAFLDFRAVLKSTGDTSAAAAAAANSSASPSATPSATPSAMPSATPSATPSAKPSATPSATPSGSGAAVAPTPSASASSAAPTTITGAGIANLNDVKKKLGPAYDAAAAITDSSTVDAATLAKIQPFAKLTPAEVAALPANIQFNTPTISCDQLNNRISAALTSEAALKAQVVACDKPGKATSGASLNKYLLDVAKVQGRDISSSSFSYDLQNYGGWFVTLNFKGSGQSAWTKLTQDAINAKNADGQDHQVAIVLDNEVVSAPNINEVIPGAAIISGGNINQDSAKTLSTQLKFGSLPLSFKTLTIDSVSATIGLAQMKAGLLAGAIGLALVVIYCLIYYRALGLVVIASLGVSASIVYASLVLLGRSLGFTLSLAGIAGFIVAIGITADSFVVFFERLKDEVKEGRSVRSSVPRAWVRARRTILSADTVSLLAALVLYILASGPVAGFAFTLGLSTIIDLIVVFLFTHPLVSVLSGSRTFTSPKFSGLGGVREMRPADSAHGSAARVGAMRTKES